MNDKLLKALLEAVTKSQMILADYLKPDSQLSSVDCVNELLGILDNQDLADLMVNQG